MYVKALTFGSGVRSHTIVGMRLHHAGVTGSGKSARRIVSQIAEMLPRGAKVPVSQELSSFSAAASKRCFGPGNEVLIDGEIHRLKILVVDGHV
jgi:hypothetical protein